jgi:hypothetical protein
MKSVQRMSLKHDGCLNLFEDNTHIARTASSLENGTAAEEGKTRKPIITVSPCLMNYLIFAALMP